MGVAKANAFFERQSFKIYKEVVSIVHNGGMILDDEVKEFIENGNKIQIKLNNDIMKYKDQTLLEEAYHCIRLQESNEAALEKFASDLHELWRSGWIKQNKGESLPRMKKGSTGEQVDINVPFAQLDPAWRKENEEAANAALQAVKQFPEDEDLAAEYIHNEWMKRNPKAEWNASQHVPYQSLPEDEKEKDRVHYRNMKLAIG